MCAVQLVLVGVATGRKVKCAGVLNPLVLLDAEAVITAVVPAELAVVVEQADTVSHLAGLTDCHAEHIRGAPAEADALDHQWVVIRDSALAVQINILLGQLGNAALGGACARQVCPDHTGHGILGGVAAVVGDLDIVALAIEYESLLAFVIGAEFRLTVNICIVAIAGLVLDDRHALDRAFDVNGLRLCVADGDFVFTCLVKGVSKFRSLGFAGLEGVLAGADGHAVYLELSGAGACIVADVDDISLDVQDVAVHVAGLAVTLLGADVGVVKGCGAVLYVDGDSLVRQLEGVRAQRLHAERAGQRCGLAGIERYDAVLELVEVTGGAVVHDRDNSRRQTLAVVRYLGGNGDFAVVQHFARGDGDIRPRKLLLVLGYQRLVGYLGFLTGCRCAVVFDIENAGTGSAGDVEEVALLVVGTRVLMGQVNGASADSRIAGYRTGVAVGVAGQQQVYLARLNDCRNVTLGVRIRYRMVHEDETEVCVLCSVGRQILLQPVHGVVDGLDGGGVSLLAGRLGVHLEQTPRVAVHGDDVQTGVIEGAVALDLCAVFFILNGVYIGVEVYTALIVVAGGIDNRIGVDVVVLYLALEPEAELLCLCAGTFYHIAAVQQQVGVKFLDGLIEFCAGRKNVRVRQGDQTDLIRFFAQGLEAGLAGRAALELYLVVVAGTGGQVVQLVVEQVHLAALEVGCVCVDLHLDRVTELALVGAVCDGRGDLLRAFPYDDHAVGLWCQKVGAVLELCAAVSRKCSRRHGHDHNSCDHSRA